MPKIAILLCTYNGEKYLEQQLLSIAEQTYQDWVVYASDESQNDKTLTILKHYQSLWGKDRLKILKGPGKGFAAHFVSLLQNKKIKADYFAFSDQDDIWLPHKLAQGLEYLQAIAEDIPALYGARSYIVDKGGEVKGQSFFHRRKPHFRNALFQSIAGGNTMMFNAAARALWARVDEDCIVTSHDWVFYILVSAIGGEVIYDNDIVIKYRQHGHNLVGSNIKWQQRVNRLWRLVDGSYKKEIIRNEAILKKFDDMLTDDAKLILNALQTYRQKNIYERFIFAAKLPFYRQLRLDNWGLRLGIVLKRI